LWPSSSGEVLMEPGGAPSELSFHQQVQFKLRSSCHRQSLEMRGLCGAVSVRLFSETHQAEVSKQRAEFASG
ncbi:MAG: hypothetical protein ACXWCO_20585, partial [Caldimonas sp.]